MQLNHQEESEQVQEGLQRLGALADMLRDQGR
jgi:hypothetical protein